MKNINKEVKNIRATIVNYANLKDTNLRTVVSGYEKNEWWASWILAFFIFNFRIALVKNINSVISNCH